MDGLGDSEPPHGGGSYTASTKQPCSGTFSVRHHAYPLRTYHLGRKISK